MDNPSKAAAARGWQRRLVARYGSWALVTGASDGIGQAIAEQLAAAGINLVLVARRRDRLEDIAAGLAQNFGVQTRVVALDLGDCEAAAKVAAQSEDLDIGLLAACAGFGSAGRFLDLPIETELDMIDVNCRALLALTSTFGRRFVRRRRGGIVLVSSLLGWQGTPFSANYAATKAYVQVLAEGLGLELGRDGVDVVASAPGPVRTGFAARAGLRINLAATPTEVAIATLQGLGRHGTVIPGVLSKLLTYSLAPLPRMIRARIMGQVMAGMMKDGGRTTEAEKPA